MYPAKRRANLGAEAMRVPLVLTIRWRMGRARARSRIRKKSGWRVGSPPEICTTSGWRSLRTTAVEHPLDGSQVAVEFPFRAAGGVADGAAQIAEIVDLDEGEAGVLLVVGTQAAIVGTAPLYGRVEVVGHLRRLDE